MQRPSSTIVYVATAALLMCTLAIPFGCRAESQAANAKKISKGMDPTLVLPAADALRDLGAPVPMTAAQRRAIQTVHTEPGELPQLTVEHKGKTLALPLKHTHVKAAITGYVARVEVQQTYHNPFDYPIEAVYIFPLPENSAVDDMKMVIGKRVIESEIKKREEAKATYEEAKRQGHTAALLEQERPNIFTQSVANIEPGRSIDVMIRYAQTLTYDAGTYEFVFPMVVGPRFIPGDPTGSSSGLGCGKDTAQVPDASRITPPVVGGGMRSGHDISVEVVAQAGLPITTWDVPTHQVQETPTFDGTLRLKLATADSIPNRDFVLKYQVDGQQPQAALLTHQQDGQQFFQLILQPPQIDVDGLVGQREMIFVIDVSGSMHGVPLAMCKDAMTEALRKLRPVDTFNVITFSGRTGQVFQRPRPANDTNLKTALQFVDGLQAGGGTLMGKGVDAALSPPVEEGRHRYVFFMTDGYIGNEAAIMEGTRRLVQALEARGQKAKVFAFGPGSSTNRHLLEGMASAGQGLAVYASTREDPTLAVNQYFHYVDHPILTDIQVDWGGLQVQEVFPTRTPDMFASRPVILQGRLNGHAPRQLTIRGKSAGRDFTMPVQIKRGENGANAVLSTLWARAKIDHLSKDLIYNGPNEQVVEEITTLGLKHRLVTAYTSLVAVDRSRTVSGKLRTILQPVETPEGVDARMAGAVEYARPAPPSGHGAVRGIRKRHTRLYAPPAPSPVANLASPMGGGAGGGEFSADAYAEPEPAAEAPSVADSLSSSASVRLVSLRIGSSGLSAATVEGVVKEHLRELKLCHERAFSGRTSKGGALELRWFITATGQVIQVRARTLSLSDAELNPCLQKAVAAWRFPAPTDGRPVEVRATLRF